MCFFKKKNHWLVEAVEALVVYRAEANTDFHNPAIRISDDPPAQACCSLGLTTEIDRRVTAPGILPFLCIWTHVHQK